ncbi:MAG TPA: aminotransferase class I/II-fold pyridoxal phosphate-dependent enzyme [Geobacterales bacterium]|nr:aminotransferase class I/II-fold pyridoxal phosphate-dependent enzyme [Geobacterales bacterium]
MFEKATSSPNDIDPRFYQRGGRLDVALEVYPNAPQPWIDLSTAISPWSYPYPPLADSEMHRYPNEVALQRLTKAAKKAYRAPAVADAVPVPGVNLGLSVLPWFFREPKRVAVLAPEHSGHAAAWDAAGHSVSQIESMDRVGNAAILIVVNPSNVDGSVVPHGDLAASLPPLKRRDGLLIVDETFADADPSHSLLPEVARLDYTLVLRSLGEFYGAAGIGLGFAVTSHPITERLRSALGAWPVSAQAMAFGEAALADTVWAESQRARLKEAAKAMDAALEAAGLRILGGQALFRLAACTSGRQLFSHLASQGILTWPFQDRNALRFGLPRDEEELSRIRQALQSWCAISAD